MKSAENTADEKERLNVLENLSVVYSPAEGRFDEITNMARRVFDVPIALVSLVAESRQWFKSAQGLNAAETPRDISFCGHAIQQDGTFIVEDASTHPWFSDNPLVTGHPNLRFYAGKPLIVNGRRIGTLCLLDQKPRRLSPEELEKLEILAKGVEDNIAVSVLSQGQQEVLSKSNEIQRADLIDPTTQTWNRPGIEQVLLHEFRIASYEKRALVLLMFAVDGLPELAQEHGPEAVDAVLAEFARRLRKSADPADALGRYDKETLVVVYDFDNEEASATKARRLMGSLTGQPVSFEESEITQPVRGASMIAYSPSTLSVADLIILTDQALSRAHDEPPGSIVFYDRRKTPRN